MAAAVTSFVPESQRPSTRCDDTSFIAISVAESPLVPKISPGGAFVGAATKANAFVAATVMGLGVDTAAVNAFIGAMAAGLGAMAAGLGAAAAGEFVDIAAAARESAWSTSFLTLGSSTSSLTIGWICTIAATVLLIVVMSVVWTPKIELRYTEDYTWMLCIIAFAVIGFLYQTMEFKRPFCARVSYVALFSAMICVLVLTSQMMSKMSKEELALVYRAAQAVSFGLIH